MKNQDRKEREIFIVHSDNGSNVCRFLKEIKSNTKIFYFVWDAVRKAFNASKDSFNLPNIEFNIEQSYEQVQNIINGKTRLVVIDKKTFEKTISVPSKEKPSHIVLLYTNDTDITNIDVSSFSYCKCVNTLEEIIDICSGIYCDMLLYYLYGLDNNFSNGKNTLFNDLKIKFINEEIKCEVDKNYRYVSLFNYSEGQNLDERVKNACINWDLFVKWLNKNKANGVSGKTLCESNYNNDLNKNAIAEDVIKNYRYGGQISVRKLLNEINRHYEYPCYLVRTIRKPNKRTDRKKLANLMSSKDFKCGLIKIVPVRNIFLYEKFNRYIDKYKLQ